jgi:hypothetical protein
MDEYLTMDDGPSTMEENPTMDDRPSTMVDNFYWR